MSLNICLISEEYPPETGWGGIGTYAHNLARGLAGLGNRVHVISRGWGDEAVSESEGVRLYRVPVPEPSWRRGTRFINRHYGETRQILLWNARAHRVLRRICAAEAVDVIESPEYHAQGLLAALSRRVPVVVRLHTPAYLCRELNRTAAGGSRLDTWISEKLEQVLAWRARLITSPSRKLAEDVGQRWRLDRPAVQVIPNPIDDELFRPAGEAPARERCLLYVGRLERRKGVEILVEALPAILATSPQTRVRLVGSDHPSGPGGSSMTSYLRRRLDELGVREGAVEFCGAVARSALPALYRSAAVCVIPSLYENFPYTCLEAMACGCAVVASASGGIPEIMASGVDGLLVPPGSAEALAEAVVRLLSDPALAGRLGQRARVTVRDRFSREAVCAETLRAYRAALGRSG